MPLECEVKYAAFSKNNYLFYTQNFIKHTETSKPHTAVVKEET